MLFKLFNGKCRRRSKVETTPFQRKVLLALQNLQGNRKFHSGASIKSIESYIAQNFKIDGDTETQIKIALDQLVLYGTVKSVGDLYTLIGSSASVALIPQICKERVTAIRKIEQIFPNTWDYCQRHINECNRCSCNSIKCPKSQSSSISLSACKCQRSTSQNVVKSDGCSECKSKSETVNKSTACKRRKSKHKASACCKCKKNRKKKRKCAKDELRSRFRKAFSKFSCSLKNCNSRKQCLNNK